MKMIVNRKLSSSVISTTQLELHISHTLPHLLRRPSASLVVTSYAHSAFQILQFSQPASTPSILHSFLTPPNSWHCCLTSSCRHCHSFSPSASLFLFFLVVPASGFEQCLGEGKCSVRFMPDWGAFWVCKSWQESSGFPASRQVAVSSGVEAVMLMARCLPLKWARFAGGECSRACVMNCGG